jgi:hypothetical protein
MNKTDLHKIIKIQNIDKLIEKAYKKDSTKTNLSNLKKELDKLDK